MYRVRHLTAYSYETQVAAATLAVRLTPRRDGRQHAIDHTIAVEPEPSFVACETDFFGNAVQLITIDTPHTALRITATARVEIDAQPSFMSQDIPWEEVVEAASFGRSIASDAPAHFLFASPRVALDDDVTDYARTSFAPGIGVIAGCNDLMTRIYEDFAYKPASTDVTTPLREAFEQREGVCQDFAHIMIAGLRGLGLPASYVSGYLRTVPPPGKTRLQGADATHAWVSVWAGGHNGWLGFDPTNAVQAGPDHIVLAVGRDFSDVSPVYGMFVGSGENKLKVEVDVIPLA